MHVGESSPGRGVHVALIGYPAEVSFQNLGIGSRSSLTRIGGGGERRGIGTWEEPAESRSERASKSGDGAIPRPRHLRFLSRLDASN